MSDKKCPLDNNDGQKDDFGRLGVWRCNNLKDDGGDMETERYACEVCGMRITLYYEDMA
jgi:hypothetical protein